jgi:hypothetical protein
MSSGYSKIALANKLGIKAGFKALLINRQTHYFDLFEDFPSNIEILKEGSAEELDFIHLFVKSKDELENKFYYTKSLLKKNGLLWVSWPKGKSKIETDINREYIREYILNNGLVDVKVCSVDDDWSALKFVYRVVDR